MHVCPALPMKTRVSELGYHVDPCESSSIGQELGGTTVNSTIERFHGARCAGSPSRPAERVLEGLHKRCLGSIAGAGG